MRGAHLAVLDQRGGVEDLRACVFGKAEHHATGGFRAAHGGQALVDLRAETAVKQQVFGWITRERQLRQHQKVGIQVAASAFRRSDDTFGIARDIAHEQVQLPESDAQLVSLIHRNGALFRAPRLGGLLLRRRLFRGHGLLFCGRLARGFLSALFDDQHARTDRLF